MLIVTFVLHFSQTVEKGEDFNNNTGKSEAPSEVELLQKVTADLKEEVKSLKEQLEREKKESNDVKSLKTQQNYTLTFKLENAVRLRERTEEEVTKVRKEMEDLREVIKLQEEETRGNGKQVELNSKSEDTTLNKNVEQEAKEFEDVVFEKQVVESDLRSKGGGSLITGELTNDVEHSSGEKKEQEKLNQNEAELNEALEKEDRELGDLLLKIENQKCANELGETDKQDKRKTTSLHGENDGRNLATESPINEGDSLFPELIQNERDKVLIKGSLLEDSPEEKEPLDYIPPKEISPLSSLQLSRFEYWKENSSIQDMGEESSHLNDIQNSSSENCISSIATSSFETCEEYVDELSPNFNTKGDIFSINRSYAMIRNVNGGLAKEMQDYSAEEDKIKLSSPNSEGRDSPSPSCPPSPGLASSGYLSNGTEDRPTNLLIHYGILEDQRLMMHPGKYHKANEATSKESPYDKDDVVHNSGTVEEDQATPIETKSLNFEANATGQEIQIIEIKEKQNDLSTNHVSEEVENLKQHLKNALKEIEDLRLENKEMKNKIRKLSSTAEENAFFVKTTQFTERLLRDIREREAMVQPARTRLTSVNYGLDSDFSYSGNLETGRMTSLRIARKSEDFLTRSSNTKVSLPLKRIGAKLKEITRSVETMTTDPDFINGETLSETSELDFMNYKQGPPTFHDQFEVEEQPITPSHSCQGLAAQNMPFKREAWKEILPSGYTHVAEKLGEETFQSPGNSKHQLTESGYALKDNSLQFDSHTRVINSCHGQELSGLENRWTNEPQDHVQRYVVRSSDYIAKLRDLRPEELAFYTNFR